MNPQETSQFNPQSPQAPMPPTQPRPSDYHPDPLGLSAAPQQQHTATPHHNGPHLPQPHVRSGVSGDHIAAAAEPNSLPHIAPVTTTNKSMFVTLSVTALFISLVGTFVLYFSNVATKSSITKAEQQIADLNNQLSQPPLSITNQKLTLVNKALAGYKAATDSKLNYQTFFESLPSLTPTDMRISSLSIDTEGIMRIIATGTSFDTAGKSLLSYAKSDYLSEITMENISLAGTDKEKTVNFEISAKLNKNKLLVNKPEATTDGQSADVQSVDGQ